MKKLISVLLILLLSVMLFADKGKLAVTDELFEDARYEENFKLLKEFLGSSENNMEKSEILWRMSRASLSIVDQLERDGVEKEKLLAEFEIARDYATESLSYNPDNYKAYYWRAANIGRWGQTKGILDSLFKADEMRDDLERAVNSNPEDGDSFNVLGMLYDSVPGVISFGNKEYAVSLARKAIDHQDKPDRPYAYNYYLELAKHLWNRKWSSKKRISEQKKAKEKFESKSSVMEKNWYYNGLVDYTKPTPYSPDGIKSMDDREEAVIIVGWLLTELKRFTGKKPGDYDDIEEGEELLAEWK